MDLMGNNMNNLLPIFIKLDDRPCLVVGGGKIALQKINQLLDCKASVTVIAPDIQESIISLPLKIRNRKYKSSDVDNVNLVIAATNDKKINQNIYIDSLKEEFL